MTAPTWAQGIGPQGQVGPDSSCLWVGRSSPARSSRWPRVEEGPVRPPALAEMSGPAPAADPRASQPRALRARGPVLG